MRRPSVWFAVLSATAALPLVLLAACGGAQGATRVTSDSQPAVVPGFDGSRFTHPTKIDNRFFPLVPGTQFRYDGFADLGDGLLPHRNIFTVTDLTKVVDGVQSRVIWDRDYSNGELVEAELALFAQDDAGNVWALGEYPEEYENGKFSGAPDVWVAGLTGTRPGIAMLAKPRLGVDYSQGLAPSIDFADRATVSREHARVCVPVDCFDGVLVNNEYDASAPSGGHQLKYYAPDVGNIEITPVGGDKEKMTLDLLSHLSGQSLAAADGAARVMDARGHEKSKVYSSTQPVR